MSGRTAERRRMGVEEEEGVEEEVMAVWRKREGGLGPSGTRLWRDGVTDFFGLLGEEQGFLLEWFGDEQERYGRV